MTQGLATLETLADTAIDSTLGYEKAAERATDANLQSTLRAAGAERRQVVSSLNNEIGRLGGTPREDGSFSGSAHRAWVDMTTMFGDKNESAVERVEEGEDYIKGKFQSALDDDDLQPESRQVVQQCYAQICEGERMSDRLDSQFS